MQFSTFSTVVGIGALALGSISVISLILNGPDIINTGGNPVFNGVASGVFALAGYKLWKSGNGFSALLFVGLVSSLAFYAGYKFDVKKAGEIIGNVGSAAVSATSAAAGAAIDSVAVDDAPIVYRSDSGRNGLKGGHRWITENEAKWCSRQKNKGLGCLTGQCPINKCGKTGK